MTPYRDKGLGSYVLDRIFPGVGRIKRATGTLNAHQFKALDQMLSTLFQAGRLDVLVAIRDGRQHPMVAWQRFERGGPAAFPKGSALLPLSTMETWAKDLRASKRHRQNVKSCVNVLLRGAHPSETLGDLPDRLRRYRETASARMFNLTRSAVQAFLRDTVGRRDPLYLDVKDVPPLPYEAQPGRPLSPDELAKVTLAEPFRAMVWTMATTGMGQAEYWGNWTPRLDRIEIEGTKRPGRKRVVPRIGHPVEPFRTYRETQDVFKAATEGHHTLYDLRRSYAGWLEEARIPLTRIKMYLGHGRKTVTDRYLWREVEPHLRADARRLTKYLSACGQRQVLAG